jgi:hypothetical protein
VVRKLHNVNKPCYDGVDAKRGKAKLRAPSVRELDEHPMHDSMRLERLDSTLDAGIRRHLASRAPGLTLRTHYKQWDDSPKDHAMQILSCCSRYK